MRIVILTRGRPGRQITLDALTNAGLGAILVVSDPADLPPRYAGEWLHYTGPSGICPKRQWTCEQIGVREKLIMLDDDLRFSFHAGNNRYPKAYPGHIRDMFGALWDAMDKYPLCTIAHRSRARQLDKPLHLDYQIAHVIGMNFSLIEGPLPHFRTPLSQDTDISLQVITRGYRTATLTDWAREDVPEAKGGCSIWRTPAMFGENSIRMWKLWPEIVVLKDDGGFRVSWKRAAEIGAKVRAKQ